METNCYIYTLNIINNKISIKIINDCSVVSPRFIATIYCIDCDVSKLANSNNSWFNKFDKVKVVSNEILSNIPGLDSNARWIWGNENLCEVYLTTMVPFPFKT